MIVDVAGAPVFVATGGRAFDRSGRVVLLVHGAGMKRTVWRLQSRYLAHHGYSVAAIDLPGHGRSGGKPLDVPGLGVWLIDLLDALDVRQGSFVGHSMGSLAVLEAAATAPERVDHLALLATGDVMPVHPELLAAADAGEHRAFELITSWSLSRPAQLGGHPEPGSWMVGGSLALLEEEPPEVLAADLHAVDEYDGAVRAAAAVTCPVLVLVGRHDRMTPPAATGRLVTHLAEVTVVELDTGHLMMTEDPTGVVKALSTFLGGDQIRGGSSLTHD